MSHIVPMILNVLVAHLTVNMQSSLSAGDPERADIVKLGRFQDDPNRKNVYLAVSGGDPDDPGAEDGITKHLMDGRKVDFTTPAYEIGGGSTWWRRGVVQLGCYWVRDRFSEPEAMEHAYNVLGRLQTALDTAPVSGVEDEYGEVAFKLFPYANTFAESGGPPKSYIWRGKVLWQCLTERQY